ncbi:MAG: OmpH family outer membrane protein [Alphaproteobacteria bacterium]|nr:MAG: OmpH family outer membrane protein [Alphaproteobacteria bacterium]
MITEISSRPVRISLVLAALLALAACGDKDENKTAEETATDAAVADKPTSVRDVFLDANTGSAKGPSKPRVLVVNQAQVFGASKAGQDLRAKLLVIQEEIGKDQDAALKAVEEEARALMQQRAILPSDQFRDKYEALVQKEQVTKQKFAKELEAAQVQGENAVMARLTPILQQIMVEKQGTILMDRSQVLLSSGSFSITEEAVKRLDEAMPTVEVKRRTWDELAAEAKALQEAREKAQAEAINGGAADE